jgi:hypothetical protein
MKTNDGVLLRIRFGALGNHSKLVYRSIRDG